MSSKRRKGGAFLIAGGLLLLAAAFLLTGYNLIDEHRADADANHALELLQKEIPADPLDDIQLPDFSEPGSEAGTVELPDYILNPDMEMPVINIEGNGYIGVLEIPALELSLPVMSEWSYPKLKIAPCRYQGSAYTGSFVIAAHNYRTHFRQLDRLKAGDQIFFTDTKGRRFLYTVDGVEILESTAVEDMLSEEWDLTLFTCTPGGQARVAVRCIRID